MLRSNFMNGILAVVTAGIVLVGFNAFFADNDDGKSASERLATYLHLDVAQVEQSEDSISQLSVDEGNDDQTVNVSVGEPATEPERPTEEVVTEPTKPAAEPAKTDDKAVVAATSDKSETVYTVKEGDTYGCISERYYGSFEHWPEIMNANPRTVGFGEYELHVGAKIVLPAILAGNLRPASSLCN